MALRFRFHIPWGFSSRLLALPPLGAAAAAVLLTDFHGYLGGADPLAAGGRCAARRRRLDLQRVSEPTRSTCIPRRSCARSARRAAVYLVPRLRVLFGVGVGAGALWPELLCLAGLSAWWGCRRCSVGLRDCRDRDGAGGATWRRGGRRIAASDRPISRDRRGRYVRDHLRFVLAAARGHPLR